MFLIGIDHDARYSAISNMELSGKYPQNARTETFFFETPKLSPSSLAFFISGFEQIQREASRIKLLVSVRETEKDYTEKLFDMTEMIVEAVESFMKAQLPIGILHSVALPNFGNEVAAYYGFNYYR